MTNNEIDKIKAFLDTLKTRLEIEDHNFRVNSESWKKIKVHNKVYLENPEKDIWEINEGEAKGEQLFTCDAAIRETEKVGKRMPTDTEFTKILKTKEDMPNLILAGYRNTDGAFFSRGSAAGFWSSTESGASACGRLLYSGYATVDRHTYEKANGFSVRCLK